VNKRLNTYHSIWRSYSRPIATGNQYVTIQHLLLLQNSPCFRSTGTYSYQWQKVPDNSRWANIGGATGAGYTLICTFLKHVLQTSARSQRILRNRIVLPAILITVYGNLTSGTLESNHLFATITAPAPRFPDVNSADSVQEDIHFSGRILLIIQHGITSEELQGAAMLPLHLQ